MFNDSSWLGVKTVVLPLRATLAAHAANAGPSGPAGSADSAGSRSGREEAQRGGSRRRPAPAIRKMLISASVGIGNFAAVETVASYSSDVANSVLASAKKAERRVAASAAARAACSRAMATCCSPCRRTISVLRYRSTNTATFARSTSGTTGVRM